MKLRDIIDLAKSGYTVEDVKELIRLGNNEDTEQKSETSDVEYINLDADNTEGQEEPETDDADQNVNNDELLKQLEDAKDLIAKLQQANIHDDISNEVQSDIDKLKDAIRSYM